MSIIELVYFESRAELEESVFNFLKEHPDNLVVTHNRFDEDDLKSNYYMSNFNEHPRRIITWDKLKSAPDGLSIKNILVYGKRSESNSDQFIKEIQSIFLGNNVMHNSGKIYVHCFRKEKREVDKEKLLVIELEDMHSEPTIYFKGEQVDFVSLINLSYETKTDEAGSLSFEIDHFEKDKKIVKNTIKKSSSL